MKNTKIAIGAAIRFKWQGKSCEGILEVETAGRVYVRPTKGPILSVYPWNMDSAIPVILDPEEIEAL